jgi:glycosidase
MRTSRVALALVALLAACSSKGGGAAPDGPPAPDAAPAGPKLHVPSPAWEEQVIYMVMIDRFADGDKSNDDQGKGEFDPANKDKYSGGDLQGIIDHLDYIQGLGATAVWITPPVANMWWDPLQQSGGYHGYWARHLKKLDEHVGTLDTYKALSAALHARGMYLIQDVVPNHMGNFFQYSSYDPSDVTKGFVKNTAAVPTSKPEQSPFDLDDVTDPMQRAAAIYHWTPAISDYTNATQELTFQVSDLDDLNTENDVVRLALRDSYAYWIKEVGVDGFRVDTAKFVPHEFWNDFFYSTDPGVPGINTVARNTGREHFLSFGEVFETPDALSDTLEKKVASFLGSADKPELSSVLAFPLYAEIDRVFAAGAATSFMTYRLGKMMDKTLYPNPYILPTFIDNHDVRRFLAVTSPTGEDLLMALGFLFTVPGIPVVYYGTEQGFVETRQAMFKGGFDQDTDRFNANAAVYQRIQKLAALRKAQPTLTHGGLEVLADSAAGPGPFVFRRTQGADSVLVALNTSATPALLAAMDTNLPEGSVLEVLHSEQAPPAPVVGVGGRMTAVLPAKSLLIAHTTGQVVAPTAPPATITVTTPIAGQTFTGDVTLGGTVTPADTKIQLVLDGNVGQGKAITVGVDGAWSVVLPVSQFATGRFDHDLAIYAPGVKVATPSARFTSDTVFNGQTYTYGDPTGDDRGPKGTYTYPTDATFKHQMDVTGVKLEVGATTMNLNLTMADLTAVWNPKNGFDHVYFNIYFAVPGQTGAQTVMPKLSASVPAGFAWTFDQFSGGFDNVMYTAAGASADHYGAVSIAPTIKVDAGTKTIIFSYDRHNFGIDSWSGVKIYITTWDYDGIGAEFRPLLQTAGPFRMGGGGPPYTPDATDPSVQYSADPKIMDDVAIITIP